MCLEFRTTESGVVKTLSLKIKNIALSLCMLIFVFGWLTVYFVTFNFATLFRYVYLICPACVMINNTGLSQPSLFLSYFNKEHLLRLCIMATNNLIWIIFTILWEKNIRQFYSLSGFSWKQSPNWSYTNTRKGCTLWKMKCINLYICLIRVNRKGDGILTMNGK